MCRDRPRAIAPYISEAIDHGLRYDVLPKDVLPKDVLPKDDPVEALNSSLRVERGLTQ